MHDRRNMATSPNDIWFISHVSWFLIDIFSNWRVSLFHGVWEAMTLETPESYKLKNETATQWWQQTMVTTSHQSLCASLNNLHAEYNSRGESWLAKWLHQRVIVHYLSSMETAVAISQSVCRRISCRDRQACTFFIGERNAAKCKFMTHVSRHSNWGPSRAWQVTKQCLGRF